VVDESHVTLPQIRGQFAGDKSRKDSLVENGFRLPTAYDNRPLTFEEFEEKTDQTLYVSATPSDYEREESEQIVEQIVRPTHLVDPAIEVSDATGQVDNLMDRIDERIESARAHARDDADQTDGRGPHRVPRGGGRRRGLHARRNRHARAPRDHPLAAIG